MRNELTNSFALFISGRSRKFRKDCLAVYKNDFIEKKKLMGLILKKCQVSMTPRGRSMLLSNLRISTIKDLKWSVARFFACAVFRILD